MCRMNANNLKHLVTPVKEKHNSAMKYCTCFYVFKCSINLLFVLVDLKLSDDLWRSGLP